MVIMGLPHTAVGVITLVIVVGWLVSLLPIFGGTQAPLDSITSTAIDAQARIATAQTCVATGANITTNNISNQVSECVGIHWYDAIWQEFTIFINYLVMIFSFLAGIFIAMGTFVTVMFGLPIQLSGIVIALISVGLIFSVIKLFIPDS